jgi:hypothetical protein
MRSTVVMMLAGGACSPSDTVHGAEAADSAGTTVTTADAALRWTPADGFDLGRPIPIGDANGDGIDDLAVEVDLAATNTSAAYLIAGPFGQSRTIPGSEFAVVPGFDSSADYDGDGIADMTILSWNGIGDPVRGVLHGPFEGWVDPAGADTSLLPAESDIDRDGFADVLLSDSGVVSLWWGPEPLVGSPADVVVDLECASLDESDESSLWDTTVVVVPDVTGDGMLDGYATGYWGGSGCWHYAFPVPESGTIVGSFPGVVVAVPGPFAAIPDQNADGVDDLLFDESRVVVAPVDFSASPDAYAVENSDLTSLFPLALDFDHDGTGDFLGVLQNPDAGTIPGVSNAAYKAVLVSGGPDNIVQSNWTTAWDIGSKVDPVVVFDAMDQHGWLIVQSSPDLLLYDLGPADVVAF